MNRAEARNAVVQALDKAANSLSDPKLSSALNDPVGDIMLADAGLDSLDEVELCIELEALVGVEIEPAEVAKFKSLMALADYVVERTGGTP